MSYFRLNNPAPKGRCDFGVYTLLLVCLLFSSCKSYYRHLQQDNADVNCIKAFRPQFTNTLYSAYVDVTKHHFSGILFFKLMPDSSMRVVFTNEMGVKFFDFAFTKDGQFIKYYILHKLDKKAIVKALRNDMRLVLLHPDLSNARALKDTVYSYVAVPNSKGSDYYITDHCEKLVRIEKASKRKPVVAVQMLDYMNGIPDSINIQHKNFKFTISLKRVEK